MDNPNDRVHNMRKDSIYIAEGKWKCKISPTGAHHWIETERGTGKFQCKHCQQSNKLPVSYTDAMRYKSSRGTIGEG